jgi:hypothetical protein
LFDECIPPEVVTALATLGLPVQSVQGLGAHRTIDEELPAIARKLDAIFVTYDLDFTTQVVLAAMARAGVCAVMIRRPKGADLADTAEIILKHRKAWPGQCGDEPSIISCNLSRSRRRALSSLPHLEPLTDESG